MAGRYSGRHMTIYASLLPGARTIAWSSALTDKLTEQAKHRIKKQGLTSLLTSFYQTKSPLHILDAVQRAKIQRTRVKTQVQRTYEDTCEARNAKPNSQFQSSAG
ncbi:MAG: hypothetical protein AAB340_02900 [Patescibacteria group bacterium]